MTDEETRKIGHCSGLVAALATLKSEIQHERFMLRDVIPDRFTRKRQPHVIKLEALEKVYAMIEKDLRRLQKHMKR